MPKITGTEPTPNGTPTPRLPRKSAREVLEVLLDLLAASQPQVPLTSAAHDEVAEFRQTITERWPLDGAPLHAVESLGVVDWLRLDDPEVPRCGLALLKLMVRLSEGLEGSTYFDFPGTSERSPIPLKRLIEMCLTVDASLDHLFRTKRDGPHTRMILSKAGRALIGGRFGFKVPSLDGGHEFSVFDLSLPYE